jgi:hypothetical protein
MYVPGGEESLLYQQHYFARQVFAWLGSSR